MCRVRMSHAYAVQRNRELVQTLHGSFAGVIDRRRLVINRSALLTQTIYFQRGYRNQAGVLILKSFLDGQKLVRY